MEQIIVTHVNGTTLSLQTKSNVSKISSASQTVELMSVDTVDIVVDSAKKLTFYIGDKITVFGRDYTLNIPAKETKKAENRFQYSLQFEGVQYDLLRAAYNVNIDTTSNEIQDVNGDALTGDLSRFMAVLISNANRVFPGKWSLGTCPSGTETKTLTFSDSDNCLSVLQDLCREDNYNTEFSIDINLDGTRVINIGATGTVHTTTFHYGKGRGLYTLTREKMSNTNIVTRLYVYGSARNITSKYRCNKLCLPEKSKAQSYVENSAVIATYGYWENTKTFDDIYPRRTGVISALGADVYSFVDSSMDFDLNEKEFDGVTTKYLMAGTAAKIHFNTGNLAGYEFDIQSYDHATKTFILRRLTDDRDMSFPSETSSAFQFATGDEYKILDITMPQTYIDNAEAELETAGEAYYTQNSQPRVQYSLVIDQFFLKDLYGTTPANIFWTGDYIPIQDTDIDVDKSIRVRGFRRNLLKDFEYDLTISDLAISISNITRMTADVIGIDKVIAINNLRDPARARRNWKTTSELVAMLDSIQAEVALIGSNPEAQFDLSGVAIKCNYGGNVNNLYVTAGTITHYYYPEGSPGTWNITLLSAAGLDPATAYYLYVKASKSDTSAVFVLSATKIEVESLAGYYHFPVGILSSVIDEIRSFQTTKGYTLISGDSIKTGRIEGASGGAYFDLSTGEIGGVITFLPGSSGYANLTDAPDLTDYALMGDVEDMLEGVQAQIDGQITTYFDTYVPTLANEPAVSWTTDTDRDKHLGDLFYNKTTGLGYRYTKTLTVYSWELLKDTDVAVALATAAEAQDTADGKRRVFTATPTTPYDVGDLWTQGTSGDLMRCQSARASGSYNSADWVKAVKYTDDTTANSKSKTYIQTSAPTTGMNTGDYWLDSDNSYKVYVYRSGSWQLDASQSAADLAVSTANAAADAAADAQADATDALDEIDDITSDTVLSAAEKPAQRQAWNVIYAEKSGINSQASTFGITTENTNYNNAFQTLANYLNNGSTWSSGIPSWLADANLGTNTTIVGATYRTNWGNLYNARTTLLNAIAAKAKTLADAAQSTANTAQSTASTAQSTANTAASNAINALNQLTTIGSDNYLSKNEKPWITKEYDALIAEQAGITASAGSMYPTELAAYTNALSALTTYLNGLSPAYNSYTTDTSIVGTTFRAKFNDAYAAKQALLNKIAEVGVPVGEESILQYYPFDEVSGSVLYDHGPGRRNGVYTSRAGSTGIIHGCFYAQTTGRYATISSFNITASFSVMFWVNAPTTTWPNSGAIISSTLANGFQVQTISGGRSLLLVVNSSTGVQTVVGSVTPSAINTWHHVTFAYNNATNKCAAYLDGVLISDLSVAAISRSASATMAFFIGCKSGEPIGCGAYIDEMYIFKYAISQKHVRHYFELRDSLGINRVKTIIDGGLVTTGRIELGDGSTIKAGINGLGTAETDIRIWAGATYAGRTAAPFRVTQAGQVVATSGVIGGWNITTDAIYSGTKSTANGFSTAGITLASNGGIHAPRFYVNADGTVGFRSGTATGKRVTIDSANNRFDLYNSSNVNVVRIDDTLGSLGRAGMRCTYASDTDEYCDFFQWGFQAVDGSTIVCGMYDNGTTYMYAKNLPTGGSSLKALYVNTTTGQIYRAS